MPVQLGLAGHVDRRPVQRAEPCGPEPERSEVLPEHGVQHAQEQAAARFDVRRQAGEDRPWITDEVEDREVGDHAIQWRCALQQRQQSRERAFARDDPTLFDEARALPPELSHIMPLDLSYAMTE